MKNQYKFVLINNISKDKFEYNLENLNPEDSIYYKFEIGLKDMLEGEYQFFLYNSEDVLLQTGLCRIGDYKKEIYSYKNNDNYIVYDNGK